MDKRVGARSTSTTSVKSTRPSDAQGAARATVHDSPFEPISHVFARPADADADLLSEVLAALRVETTAVCVFDFHGPWGVQLDHMPLSVSWTVTEGTVWMKPPGAEPIAFNQGDTFLLPRGIDQKRYLLGSSVDAKLMHAGDFWRQAELRGFEPGAASRRPQHVRWDGQGPLTRVVSTAFALQDSQLGPLVAALPELMVIRASEAHDEGEFINTLLRLVLGGDDAALPGFSTIAAQAAQMLLVQVVRRYAMSIGDGGPGWLAGLGDPQIARALVRIHRQPDCAWTVAGLARAAGLSRSIFAERFLARVGQTPIQYLRAWRIHLAREALATGRTTVAALSHDLGYNSEASFRNAFRRITGRSPQAFRRNPTT